MADAFTADTAAVTERSERAIRRNAQRGESIADAKRNRLTDAYAPVREAARAKQIGALERGNKTRHQASVQEQIPEPAKPAPQTRDIRAKAAGTNAKYIDVADRLVAERPTCPALTTDSKPVMEAPHD